MIEYIRTNAFKVSSNVDAAKMYHTAVQSDSWLLRIVPEQFKTPEMCFAAVQNAGGVLREEYGEVIKYVPEALKTAEVCLLAKQNMDHVQ